MIRIGLTGGIGAGKSTVARIFIERGAYLIDADKIAREVVDPGSDGLRQLVEAFGEDILDGDGGLDRQALAAKAFVDDEQRGRLNAITHPLIGARTAELLAAAPDDAVVVQDIPLLVENLTAPFFHLVVIVGLDSETRLHRLTTVRGMAEEDVRSRIAAQATDEQRRTVADIWLDNSGTPEDLADAAQRVWNERLVPFEANLRNRAAAVPDAELIAADPNIEALGPRLTNRLWAILGEKAAGIEYAGASESPQTPGVMVPEIAVTLAGEADDAVNEVLAEGGFPQAGDRLVHRSADPGRPALVILREV